jgi:ABC-type phosphate transport system substrate-binding protein
MKKICSTIVYSTLIAGLLLCFCNTGFAEDLIVILNKEIPDTAINKDDIKNIYLGDKITWSDSSTIIVTTLEKGPEHEQFLKDYVGRSLSQFKMTWKKLMFTGKGKSPKEFGSAAEMIDFVAQNKGAIGYMAAGSGNTDNVNVISLK